MEKQEQKENVKMKIKVKKVLSEQQWNKDSNTPRDYSKEYDAPGSKEQDERNKRKRDKRKHDKEHGKCSDNQDLHHVNGIENSKVKCEPPYINRGRKEKSRLKDDEIVIKIMKSLRESTIDKPPSGKPVSLNQQGPKGGEDDLEAKWVEFIKKRKEQTSDESDRGSGSSIRAEGEKSLNEWSLSDTGHLVLDIAGLIPFVGPGFDVTNAIWYAAKGEFLMASLSIVAIIPGVGDVLGLGAKAIIKTGKGGGKAMVWMGKKIQPHLPDIFKFFDKIAKEVPKIAEYIPRMKAALKKAFNWSVLHPTQADKFANAVRSQGYRIFGKKVLKKTPYSKHVKGGVDDVMAQYAKIAGEVGPGAAGSHLASPFATGAAKELGRRQAHKSMKRFARGAVARVTQRELVRWGPLSLPGRIYDYWTGKVEGSITDEDQEIFQVTMTNLAQDGSEEAQEAFDKIWDTPGFDREAWKRRWKRRAD